MSGAFSRNKFKLNPVTAWYRRRLRQSPFLAFGLPFLVLIVGGSFVLTPFTAVRYERFDRKIQSMSEDEQLAIRRGARKVDMRDEYNRLLAKDVDSWEQKRVKRLKDEPDGEI